MLPDADDVNGLILKVEQGVHHQGWDQDPFLAALRWRPPALGLRPIPVPIGNPPGDFLKALAWAVQAPSDGDRFAASMPPDAGFFGLAFIAEGWLNEDLEPGQYEALDRPLADIVGSVECRHINAVDITGRAHQVIRVRGRKPEYQLYSPGGRVLQALLDMVRVVAARMPPGSVDLQTLGNAKILTPAEVAQRLDDLRNQ